MCTGGHTTEMLTIFAECDRKVYQPVVYVIASTDVNSEPRARKLEVSCPCNLAVFTLLQYA